jgi:hypothetical protein
MASSDLNQSQLSEKFDTLLEEWFNEFSKQYVENSAKCEGEPVEASRTFSIYVKEKILQNSKKEDIIVISGGLAKAYILVQSCYGKLAGLYTDLNIAAHSQALMDAISEKFEKVCTGAKMEMYNGAFFPALIANHGENADETELENMWTLISTKKANILD